MVGRRGRERFASSPTSYVLPSTSSSSWERLARLTGELASRADDTFMQEALAFARIAFSEGEVPIGAVVVRDGRLLGRGRNRREALADPTHHAEIEALREAASAVGTWRLEGATLYATLEPCAMCAGAAVNARIARIVFGCTDPKAGYCGTLGNVAQDERLNHRCEVSGGVLAEESAQLLRMFFQARRGR